MNEDTYPLSTSALELWYSQNNADQSAHRHHAHVRVSLRDLDPRVGLAISESYAVLAVALFRKEQQAIELRIGCARAHGSFKQSQVFKILVAVSDVLQPNALNGHACLAANAVWSAWVQHVAVAVAAIN